MVNETVVGVTGVWQRITLEARAVDVEVARVAAVH